MSRPMYDPYEPDHRNRGRREQSTGLILLVAATAVLLITVFIVLIATVMNGDTGSQPTDNGIGGIPEVTIGANQAVLLPAVTDPSASVVAGNQNPVLYPSTEAMNILPGILSEDVSVTARNVLQNVYQEQTELIGYSRDFPVFFGAPMSYQGVPGILTFRGNNFRNCASWGTVTSGATTLEQVWEYGNLGSLASTFDYNWSGTGWTGQPIVVTWSDEVRACMNLYPEKKLKSSLTEIIQVAMDGKIYFLDMDDGSPTRDPLNVGFTIKGTPCLDPRGYPILYIGQGDNNGADKKIGFRIISLIDYSVLYFQNGVDVRAHRSGWGACDSSPIVNAASDTLIFPNENGLIYTLKLNTVFNAAMGSLTMTPESVVYRYLPGDVPGSNLGIESSISVYGQYGYASDYSGNLICLDLNTLQMVWIRQLDDDSDVTPVISEEDGHVYLYTGTEVDWQREDVLDYLGAAYTYKIDAMTGEVVWRTSADCYTKNGEDKADDVNGGMLGTPVVGKKSIENLVIFSYCMTKGEYSGNRLVAYDKETGETVWTYDMNHYSWSSPVDCYDAEGNAYIVICDSIGQVHLVNGLTGERITFLQTIRGKGTENEIKSGINMESSPVVFGDMIIIGSRYRDQAGSVFAIRIG